MRSHSRACRKTCEQYERIWARLPGAPVRAAGRRGRRRGAQVRHRGPRQRRLFAGPVAVHWTEYRPTCRGVAAGCRCRRSNRWQLGIENGLPGHRGARAAVFHRPGDAAAGRGCTRPVLRSSANGVRRSWDRRPGRRCSPTRRERDSRRNGGCGRRTLFLPARFRHPAIRRTFHSWFTSSSETAGD